jgi:hypothetical protein
LEFAHPADGRIVKLEADLPHELWTVLKRLGIKL